MEPTKVMHTRGVLKRIFTEMEASPFYKKHPSYVDDKRADFERRGFSELVVSFPSQDGFQGAAIPKYVADQKNLVAGQQVEIDFIMDDSREGMVIALEPVVAPGG